MSARRISRTVSVASLVLAPVFGLAAAAATPALVSSSARSQLLAISHHQNRFYIYALCITISSYLLVPAVAGIMRLMPDSRPAWAEVAGALTQLSMLVAIGDAASELIFWKAGSPDASLNQMTALSDRLDASPGYSLIYTVGGLCGIVGSILLAVALIRTHAAPAWSAVLLPVGFVVNIVGFSIPSQAVLVASYILLTAGFVRFATLLRAPATSRVTTAPGTLVSTELGGQSAR